jgi:hypothetical protein
MIYHFDEEYLSHDIFSAPRSSHARVIHYRLLSEEQRNGTFTLNMWHELIDCTGEKCPWHPLFTSHQEVQDSFIPWHTLHERCTAEDLARETDADREARIRRELELAEQNRIREEVIRQERYARELEFRQSLKAPKAVRGSAPVKKLILAPCKWLYAIDGKDNCFDNKPCSECWGHEYTNAKGEFTVKHKCEYVHPNQPEWKAEWMALPITRDRWRPPAGPTSENRFENIARPSSSKNRPVGPREY